MKKPPGKMPKSSKPIMETQVLHGIDREFESLPTLGEHVDMFSRVRKLCGNGYPGIKSKKPPKEIIAGDNPWFRKVD